MTTPEQIQNWIETLSLNQWIIQKQSEGLSHDDTMLEAPFRANRMNWVLGHLAEHRDWMLRALDETTLLTANQAMTYRRGSDALDSESDVMQVDVLLGILSQAKDCLIAKLGDASPDFLSEKPQTGVLLESHKNKTRFERLQGLLWHETYHTGQLELLRQLAGTNDAILK